MVASALRHAPALPQSSTAAPPEGFLRLATLDHGTVAATWLWSSTVAGYAAHDWSSPELTTAIRVCGSLDPKWKAPWVYGATMLRSMDDLDAQERVLEEAIAVHPEEPWFPYMLGMSRHIQGDKAGAIKLLDRAADLSGASEVHRRAARAIRER